MQKFNKGDHVKICDVMPQSMSHFQCGKEAIVIGSYNDQYGGGDAGDKSQYTLHIKGSGQHSWYYESQLTIIEKSRNDLLSQWEDEKEKERKIHSDLDWIFDNAKLLNYEIPGASVQELATRLGFGRLWGSNGEGVSYFLNSIKVMEICLPFLVLGDKNKFLDAIDNAKQKRGESK